MTTRMAGFQWMHVSSAIHQYVTVISFGLKLDLVKGGAPPRPTSTFARPWIHPLLHLAETTARIVAFQVMHVSPTNYSDGWQPRKCDYRTYTDKRTDRRWTKWSLCAVLLRRRQKKTRMAAFQVKLSSLKKFFEVGPILPAMHSFCCCSHSVLKSSLNKGAPLILLYISHGRIWPINNNTCAGSWVMHPYQVS